MSAGPEALRRHADYLDGCHYPAMAAALRECALAWDGERDKATELNRRVTIAEGEVLRRIDAAGGGPSLGRALANAGFSALRVERDGLREALDDVYERLCAVERLLTTIEQARLVTGAIERCKYLKQPEWTEAIERRRSERDSLRAERDALRARVQELGG